MDHGPVHVTVTGDHFAARILFGFRERLVLLVGERAAPAVLDLIRTILPPFYRDSRRLNFRDDVLLQLFQQAETVAFFPLPVTSSGKRRSATVPGRVE